jgi:DNA-binding NarL/FixJ family response regulator
MAAACRVTQLPPERLPLAQIWAELVSGNMRVFARRQVSFLRVITTASVILDAYRLNLEYCFGERVAPPLPADAELLQRYLMGAQAKVLAANEEQAPSTISRRKSLCLEAMGLRCRPSQAPLLLVLAAHAAAGCLRVPDAAVESSIESDGTVFTIIIPRIDAALDGLLPPRQRTAVRRLIDGRSNQQIADDLGKSKRTIINQLCSSYRELQASGRLAVVARLLEG